MSDKIRVTDMTQSTQHALSKVLEFAREHPESQFLYEAWQNLDRALDRLNSYYRQQFTDRPDMGDCKIVPVERVGDVAVNCVEHGLFWSAPDTEHTCPGCHAEMS